MPTVTRKQAFKQLDDMRRKPAPYITRAAAANKAELARRARDYKTPTLSNVYRATVCHQQVITLVFSDGAEMKLRFVGGPRKSITSVEFL